MSKQPWDGLDPQSAKFREVVLKSKGFDPDVSQLKVTDLPELGVAFLETMGEIHSFSLEMYLAKKARADHIIPEIKMRESKLVDRIMVWYKIIEAVRAVYRDLVMSSPQLMNAERKRCRESYKHFINQWAYIEEPRLLLKTSYGEFVPTNFPFIMYPAQEKAIDQINSCYENRMSFIVGKSREAGISWVTMTWGVWRFLFYEGFTLGAGSEKADKVDQIGNTNTLLGKVRHIIYGLPDFLRPSGYKKDFTNGSDGKVNNFDNFMKILNPDNRSKILGEQGKEIGRSGRYSVFIIDESQDLSYPDSVDAALESTTFCRGDVGTPKGMNHFGQKWHSDAIINICIMWYQDPRKTARWRENLFHRDCAWRKKLELEKADRPAQIAQEYDLDFQSSVSDLCIPAEWVQSCIDADIPFCDNPDHVAGFDIAGGGSDHAVYVTKKGNRLNIPKELLNKDVVDNMIDAHNNAVSDGVNALFYDAVTIGESMQGVITRVFNAIPYVLMPVKGTERATDRYIPEEGKIGTDAYYNKRAEVWCNLRRLIHNTHRYVTGASKNYSPEELLSIPNYKPLIEQLSYPKLLKKNGRHIVESKEDMKSRGLRSPDYGDTAAYCCAGSTGVGSERAVGSFKPSARFFRKIDVDYNGLGWEYIVSVYRSDLNETGAILCRWHPQKKIAEVVGESVDVSPMPDDILNAFSCIVNPSVIAKCKWVLRSDILKQMMAGTAFEEYKMYTKAGLKPHFNMVDDQMGQLVFLNTMFNEERMVIGYSCTITTGQLTAIEMSSKNIDQRYTLVHCMLQVVGMLREKKMMDIRKVVNKGYGIKQVSMESLVKKITLERLHG